jgi:hypothetical protein
LEEENKKINNEKEYWHREAIRLAAELGELKIKLGGFIEKNYIKD